MQSLTASTVPVPNREESCNIFLCEIFRIALLTANQCVVFSLFDPPKSILVYHLVPLTKKVLISKLKFSWVVQRVKFTGCQKSFVITIKRNRFNFIFFVSSEIHSSPCYQAGGCCLRVCQTDWITEANQLVHCPSIVSLPYFFFSMIFYRLGLSDVLFNHFLNRNANSFQNILPT